MIVTDEKQRRELSARNRGLAESEFERLYYAHEGRRMIKWHHFLTIYERHLAPYRKSAEPVHVLEIGVRQGGSLQLWRKFFGPSAVIVGIDIETQCKDFADEGVEICIGNQADPAFLRAVVKQMGGVQIVIDDGSHIATDQVTSFKTLWPLLASGGVYICEDLHTSYWDNWQGGQGRTGTFIETIKAMVDELHRWYAAIDTPLSELNLHTEMTGIHIYDSLAILDKGMKEPPYAVEVGGAAS